jgi:hypothetical protein
MQEILKASLLYRALTAFFGWIGARWRESALVRWFLSTSTARNIFESSVVSKLWRFLHRLLSAVFRKLRLTRLLKGSIFRQTFLWCLLPAALAPVLDTKLVLALAAVGVFSMAVRFGCDENARMPSSRQHYIGCSPLCFKRDAHVVTSPAAAAGLLTVFVAEFALFFSGAVTSKKQRTSPSRSSLSSARPCRVRHLPVLLLRPPRAPALDRQRHVLGHHDRVYRRSRIQRAREYCCLNHAVRAAFYRRETWPRRLFFLGCLLAMLVACG